jgi:anti-sigma B factor antagonist
MLLQPTRPLTAIQADDTAVVVLEAKRFGEPFVHSLGEELSGLADSVTSREFCLDLSRVESISALGLGKLVAVHRKMKARGGRVSLLNPRPQVYHALQTTRLITLFEVRRGSLAPAAGLDE